MDALEGQLFHSMANSTPSAHKVTRLGPDVPEHFYPDQEEVTPGVRLAGVVSGGDGVAML